jgi:hypothetical protein
MLDYYYGFRTAAEDLEQDGLKLKLFVYDTQKDSNSLNNTLDLPALKTMDIIVGPVYDKEMAMVEKFCNANNILLISPLKFCKPNLKDSKIINFFVADSVRIQALTAKVIANYPGYKFYLATDNSKKSKDYLGIMKRELNRQKKSAKTLIYNNAPIAPTALPKDSVVILSTIATTSSKDILLKAVKAKNRGYLIGHIEWHSASLSTFGIDEPRLIYPEMNFTNPADSAASKFHQQFLNQKYIEPSKYAYIGYDQATYLCYSLMAFGTDFINHLPDAEYRGFINGIRLTNTPYGIQNTGLNFIQIVGEERIEYKP